jgi:hypothetical protein
VSCSIGARADGALVGDQRLDDLIEVTGDDVVHA